MTLSPITFPLALGMPGPLEMMFLLGIGLLFFGKRLPEVGRSVGQTIVQFKKGLNEAGLNDISHDIRSTPSVTSLPPVEAKPVVDPSEFKFDPHTGKPIERVS